MCGLWIAPRTLFARACVGERPDDLVGDVDAAARPDDLLVLEHDVELFGLRDLPHGTIGALDDALELFLAPLPRSSLNSRCLRWNSRLESANSRSRFRRSDSTSSPRSSPDSPASLQLLGLLGKLLAALREFLLQFLLRQLSGRRFAQDTLQADEAMLAWPNAGPRASGSPRARIDQGSAARALPSSASWDEDYTGRQNTVPSVNWTC